MPDFLSSMAEASRLRAAEARSRLSEGLLMRRAAQRSDPPVLRLDAAGFDVIAELKPASPVAGRLAALETSGTTTHVERAARYAEAGACAISVLTEPTVFGGSLDLLGAVAQAVAVPVLRKDFLVDPYQVAEARDEGASGVLLIARLLAGTLLDEMLNVASELRLFALVEAFDRADLERAIDAASASSGLVLVGVNARDLETLTVDPQRLGSLAAAADAGFPFVAESGLRTPEDAAGVAVAGYRAALVGEALMREADPRARLAAMIDAGRRAADAREAVR